MAGPVRESGLMANVQRETRFHALMAEAVREYEKMQSVVEAGGTKRSVKIGRQISCGTQAVDIVCNAEPSGVTFGTDGSTSAKSSGSPVVLDAEQYLDMPGLGLDEDMEPLSESTRSEASEQIKTWVCCVWEHFTVHLVKRKHNYVLRPSWGEANPGVRSSSARRRSLVLLKKRMFTSNSCSNLGDIDDGDILNTTWKNQQNQHKTRLLKANSKNNLGSFFQATDSSPCMLHPDSNLRVTWAAVGMLFLALDVFYLTMSVFDILRGRWLDIIDGLYWTLDMVFCFRTGTYLNGEVSLNARRSMRTYLRGWFVFDLILVVYQWTMMGLESQSTGQAGFIRYTRLARLVKLLRLTKLTLMINQVSQRIDNIYVLLGLRLVLYTGGLTFYVHVSRAVWFMIGQSDPKGWVQQHEEIFKKWPLSSIGSFHWAVTQMQGSAEIMPGNLKERAASALHYMMSIIVLALFISKLTTVLQAIADIKSEEQKLTRVAYSFMQANNIRVDLRIKLQRFLSNEALVLKRSQAPQLSEFFAILPPSLRQALLVEVRVPMTGHGLLMKSLHHFHTSFAEQVTCLMHSCLHQCGEKVFEQGVMCNKVYFLEAGVGLYLPCSPFIPHIKAAFGAQSPEKWKEWHASYKNRTAHRVDEVGTIWCECVLFVRWIYLGVLEADPNASLSLLVLDAQEFEDVVALCMEVHQSLTMHAARVGEFLATNTYDVTDLFRSERVMA